MSRSPSKITVKAYVPTADLFSATAIDSPCLVGAIVYRTNNAARVFDWIVRIERVERPHRPNAEQCGARVRLDCAGLTRRTLCNHRDPRAGSKVVPKHGHSRFRPTSRFLQQTPRLPQCAYRDGVALASPSRAALRRSLPTLPVYQPPARWQSHRSSEISSTWDPLAAP
jgi:hypothetical protein